MFLQNFFIRLFPHLPSPFFLKQVWSGQTLEHDDAGDPPLLVEHLFLLVQWLICPTPPLNDWFAKAWEEFDPLPLLPPEGRLFPGRPDEGRWLPSWPFPLLEGRPPTLLPTCWFELLMPAEGRLFPNWPDEGLLFADWPDKGRLFPDWPVEGRCWPAEGRCWPVEGLCWPPATGLGRLLLVADVDPPLLQVNLC